MTWSAYFNLASLVLILGLGLAGHAMLATVYETLERLWRRRFHWASERLKAALGRSVEIEGRKTFRFSPRRFVMTAAIPTLPILLRDGMLATLAVLAGIGLIWWTRHRDQQAMREKIDMHAELLALRLRSLLPVERSILRCLRQAGAELPPGELASAISQVCARLEMKQTARHACEPLQSLPGTVTRRLGTLLAESVETRQAVQMDLLAILEREIHHRRMLQNKMRQSLTLVRGTIRVLQGAVAAGLAAAVTLPLWRAYFLADLPHRALLVGLMSVSILASLYFELEVSQMMRGENL